MCKYVVCTLSPLCAYMCIDFCAHVYTYMWLSEVGVRNHPPYLWNFIFWGSISQSHPELKLMAYVASQLTLCVPLLRLQIQEGCYAHSTLTDILGIQTPVLKPFAEIVSTIYPLPSPTAHSWHSLHTTEQTVLDFPKSLLFGRLNVGNKQTNHF